MCQRGYVDEEFSCDRFAQDSHIKHAAASESLLEHYGIPQEIACILGAHMENRWISKSIKNQRFGNEVTTTI